MPEEGPWVYSGHHWDFSEGHLFLSDAPEGVGCMILLTGAASMTQEALDKHGRLIAEAVNGSLRLSTAGELL